MAWLRLKDMIIPTADESHFDHLRVNCESDLVKVVPLTFKTMQQYLLELLKQFKNKASWQFITIHYCYRFRYQKTCDGVAIIDLRRRGFLRQINNCIFELIHHYQMFLIGKIVDWNDRIIDAQNARGFIQIKKICVHRPHRRR